MFNFLKDEEKNNFTKNFNLQIYLLFLFYTILDLNSLDNKYSSEIEEINNKINLINEKLNSLEKQNKKTKTKE